MRNRWAAIGFLALAMFAAPLQARERVGTSLGQPVYRDQLAGTTDAERAESAQALFVAPALDEYFRANRAALQPDAAQLAEVSAALDARRACEPHYLHDAAARDFMARYLLANRNLLRHVHSRFGGGRLLFQQAGMEAFDATRRLVEHLEAQGRLTFDDAKVRRLAFHYWTRDHGPFLVDDPARIREALEGPLVAACTLPEPPPSPAS
ncbi:MAG TPA: hypothetical protein VIG54_10075 [Lysobacter sp.]